MNCGKDGFPQAFRPAKTSTTGTKSRAKPAFSGHFSQMNLFFSLIFALSGPWSWPVEQQVIVHDWEKPDTSFSAGHRGLDLLSRVGAEVYASASGVVQYTGSIDSVPAISISHGEVRSTYQPVSAVVQVGQEVRKGELIGHLVRSGNHCQAVSCLHFGVKRDAEYLDPKLFLANTPRVVLIDPNGPPPLPAGVLPVTGPITSPMGWRIHPITGRRHFHDGIDFAAPCGTRVRSVDSGRVSFAGSKGGYGKRVEIKTRAGVASYSHLSKLLVRSGDEVERGSVVGNVGTTGTSTGCHLHFTPAS